MYPDAFRSVAVLWGPLFRQIGIPYVGGGFGLKKSLLTHALLWRALPGASVRLLEARVSQEGARFCGFGASEDLILRVFEC